MRDKEKEDIGVLIIDEVLEKIECLSCNLCTIRGIRRECVFDTDEWGRRVFHATKDTNKRKEMV